jgi:hypothetical protein
VEKATPTKGLDIPFQFEGTDIQDEGEEGLLCSRTSRKGGMKRKNMFVVASRKSSMLQQKGDQNLREKTQGGVPAGGDPGMHNDLINSFAVLNFVDDDNLEQIALDCDINLGGASNEMKGLLAL